MERILTAIKKGQNNIKQLCDMINSYDKDNGGNGRKVLLDDFAEILLEAEALLKDKQSSLESKSDDSLHFSLIDECESGNHSQTGVADANSDLGVSLYFDGYGSFGSNDESGTPIYVEKYDGELKVLIYADINSEEPSHSISLEGARLTQRKEA